MKKVIGLFSLSVMLLTQIITPFAYATGDITPVEETVVEEPVVPVEDTANEDEATAGDEVVIEPEEKVQPEADFSVGGGDKSNPVEQQGTTGDDAQISGGNSEDNHDAAPVELQSGTTEEANSGDITKLSGDNENLKEEQVEEKIGNGSGEDSKTGFFETIKNFFGIGESKEEEKEQKNYEYETQVITGEAEYDDVKVEVYADTGLFYSGTELIIKAVTGDMYEGVKEVLSGQLEKIAEEEQTVVAFDISFIYSGEEVQPLTGTVQVSFNYENNEDLKAAEENEEQEVKVYHLNDKDDEGNKIEELTGTIVEEVVVNEEESEEENVMVVEAESFSVYTIVVQVRQEQLISFQYGMISIANPSNPSQMITIMDRNLGATSNDITDKSSYGYHYQRGNNYGFDSSKDISEISTSSTQVNVSSLTEYSGSTFIMGNTTWMTSSKNLWGVGGQGPCPDGWHVPTRYERSNLYSYYKNTYANSGTNGFLDYFKLPYAGYRGGYNGNLYEQNHYVMSWSSTQNGNYAYRLYIYVGMNGISDNYYSDQAQANTVRCFKNTPVGASNLHKITIDYRGGKGSIAFINVEHGSTAQVPSTPTRRNSNFLGWYLSGTDTEFNFNGTTITEDISIYAKWSCNYGFIENSKGDGCVYVVSYDFDANGGFFSGEETNTVQVVQYFCDELECYTNDNLKNPDRVSLDISQQSGWMFAGWYMKSGINGDWGEEFNPKTAMTSTVYAKWLPFNDISIKDGDQVGFTIMDRNLGAESTSYGSSLDGIGYYYQWGNNYGFSSNSNVTIRTSSEKVDASGYGPDNYYSSNIFIKKNSSQWDLSNNKNLWGGMGDSLKTRGEGTDEDRQGPCPVGYHVPSTLEWNFAYNVRYNSKEKSTDEDSNLKNFIKDFKLPFVGLRSNSDGNVTSQGTYGYYLSSSPVSNSTSVYALYITNGGTFNTQDSVSTTNGYPLRCFKNLSGTKKIQYFTETGEKITESILDWWNSIPYINVERTGYEFLGWFESGSSEEFDFTENIARSVSLYERWLDIDGITEANTAKLLNGKKFNAAIKTLATGAVVSYLDVDEQIKGIERSEILPEGGVKKLISSDASETPIFAWYETETQKIKYYTKAKDVYMNEDSSYMYYYLKNLSSINLEEFKTDYVRNMDWMFGYSCSSVDALNLDFRNLNLSNVTSMSNMFNDFFYKGTKANNITINFSKMDLSNVKNVDKMFYYSFAYVENTSGVIIDFRETDLSSAEKMDQMFYCFCYGYNDQGGASINGVTVDFSKADLSSVMNMEQMFYYAFAYDKRADLVTINFSEANMRSVTNMNQMFYDFGYGDSWGNSEVFSGITIDFSKADMRSVTNMNNMFDYAFYDVRNASGITIDFYEADMRSVVNMNNMFHDFCYSSLSSPYNGGRYSGITVDFRKADLSSVMNMGQMFSYAFAYDKSVDSVTIDFSEAIMGSVTNMNQMFYYFGYGNSYGSIEERGSTFSGIIIDFSNVDLSSVQGMNQMFYNMFWYTKNINGVVINFSDKDTSEIDVDGMTIDFSNVDLSNVTGMGGMFYQMFFDSENLYGIKINFNKANLGKVTNTSQMFYDFGYGNSSLANYSGVVIDFSEADMSSVESMGAMFQYGFAYGKSASGVVIDFSKADMSNLKSMDAMFQYSFKYAKTVTGVNINFKEAKMGNVESMGSMFSEAFSRTNSITGVMIDFSEVDLHSVKNMASMFYFLFYGSNGNGGSIINGVTLDFSKVDMRNVENMGGMFYRIFAYAKSVASVNINFSEANISSVKNMNAMFTYNFSYCNNLSGIELNFRGADISSVENMNQMFYYFGYMSHYLEGMTIDFSKADMSSVENMSEMFRYCFSNAETITGVLIDFREADMRSVTNMNSMFYYFAYVYTSKTDQIDIKRDNSKFTSSLTDMGYMFYYSYGVTGLDLSNFDTSNVTNMNYMFTYANNLKTIYVGSRFRTNNVTTSTSMFSYALSIEGGNGTKYNESNPKDKTYARVDKVGEPGYFTKKGEGTVATLLPGHEFNAKIKTMAKGSNATYNDSDSYIKRIKKGTSNQLIDLQSSNGTYEIVSTTYSEKPVYAWYIDSEKTIYYYSTADEIDMNTDASNMFAKLTKLEEVELEGINTHGVSNMTSLFQNDESLTGLDLNNFDASSVTNMQNMFNGCGGLKSVNLSNANMSRVTNITGIFGGCSNLESVDFSNADIRSLTSFSSIFPGLPKLREVNFHKVNLNSLESTQGMFGGISSLKYADFSDANLKRVQTTESMFGGSGLTGADFSNADLRNTQSTSSMFGGLGTLLMANFENTNMMNVINMPSMFGGCNNLNRVTFSGSKMGNVTNMSYMFGGDSKLETVDFTKVNLSKLENMSSMFGGCSGLTGMDFSKMDLSRVTNMNGSFAAALKLESVNFGDNDFRNVTDMGRLFLNCISLEELDITKFDTRNVTNMNEMFRGAKNLKTIYVGDNFKTGSVTDGTDMFLGAESIVGGNGTKYESNYIGVINAKIDNEYYSGYFTDPNHFVVKYLTVTGEELLKQWISTGQTVEELEDSHKSYRYYTSGDLQTGFDFTELLYGYTEIYVAWDDVNYVTYEYGTGVEEGAISSGSCLIPRDNNGVAQSESCEVVLPELNVLTGYHTPLWYKKGTNIIYPNLTITLTGDVVLEAKATANNYTVVYKPGEGTGEMQSQEFEYDKEGTLNKNKYTKEGYHFNGWIDLIGKEYKDGEKVLNLLTEGILELTAQWLQNAPAAGGGRIIEQKNKVEDQEHESAEEKQEDQEIKQDEQQDNQQGETMEEQTNVPEKNNSSSQSSTQQSSSSSKENTVTVDPEIQSAYEWAYERDVTTIPSLDDAMPDGVVKRGHLAKMVVNYATNVLGREIPEKIPSECRWNDGRKDWESEEIKNYAVKSCALGLMGLDMEKFLPNMQVTRAQFGTIMSRLLWGKKYAGGTPYYRKHLNALKENGIMTQIENPERRVELRQWVWLMLMRSVQNK